MKVNPTIEVDFRDYVAGEGTGLGDGSLALNTGGEVAKLGIEYQDERIGEDVVVKLGRDAARELGTDLLRWTGSPLTHTLDDVAYETIDGLLKVRVTDGEAMLLLGDIDADAYDPPQYQPYTLADEDVADFAQRLIVWAGVAGAPAAAPVPAAVGGHSPRHGVFGADKWGRRPR